MKTKIFLASMAVAGITFLFASCTETMNNVEDQINEVATTVKSSEFDAFTADSCTLTGTLTDAEIEGLMEMREEEKLAHDVYVTLFNKWGHIVFSNISKSESAHTSAVLYLINGYGLNDPALTGYGEFSNPLFAGLFVQLTGKGSESLVEALKIGAFIEEYDIADLERLLEETQNKDVLRVYGHLLSGSKNHLRAFTNSLKKLGETYTPTVITEGHYQEILSES